MLVYRTIDKTRNTSIDSMFIEESKENKVVELQFVEAQAMQMNAREENIIEAEV